MAGLIYPVYFTHLSPVTSHKVFLSVKVSVCFTKGQKSILKII